MVIAMAMGHWGNSNSNGNGAIIDLMAMGKEDRGTGARGTGATGAMAMGQRRSIDRSHCNDRSRGRGEGARQHDRLLFLVFYSKR
jgi:hypothetical protein